MYSNVRPNSTWYAFRRKDAVKYAARFKDVWATGEVGALKRKDAGMVGVAPLRIMMP